MNQPFMDPPGRTCCVLQLVDVPAAAPGRGVWSDWGGPVRVGALVAGGWGHAATSRTTLRVGGNVARIAPVLASIPYTAAPCGLVQVGVAVFASSQVSYPPPMTTTGPVCPSTLAATAGVDQVCP